MKSLENFEKALETYGENELNWTDDIGEGEGKKPILTETEKGEMFWSVGQVNVNLNEVDTWDTDAVLIPG